MLNLSSTMAQTDMLFYPSNMAKESKNFHPKCQLLGIHSFTAPQMTITREKVFYCCKSEFFTETMMK